MLRRRKNSIEPYKECLGNAYKLLESYTNSSSVEDVCEALAQLVGKGYSYWLLENKYDSVKLEDPVVLDFTVRYGKILHAYFNEKMLLRELLEDFKRLLFSLSSILSEIEPLCRKEQCSFDPGEYRRLVYQYYERYVKSAYDNVIRDDEQLSIDDLTRDTEILLDHFRKLKEEGYGSSV
jgi:hypothetical protein